MAIEIITLTVGSAIVSFLVEKSLMSAARLPMWFRKRPSAFKSFDKGQTTVILSSLYPKSIEDFVIKPISVVSGDSVKAMRVTPPAPLTGIRDSFGLANLVVTLFRLKANFVLRVDPISDTEKENNLIVFGLQPLISWQKSFMKNIYPRQRILNSLVPGMIN